MVRTNVKDVHPDGAAYVELAGLSTDDKPISYFATGSLFLEVNTGDVYAYDEASSEWSLVCSLGGSGS